MPKRSHRSILDDPTILERIEQGYALMLPDRAVCAHAGITDTTFYRYMRRGADEEKEAGLRAKAEGIDPELLEPPKGSAWAFYRRVTQARYAGQINAHATLIAQAQAGRPGPLMRLLERRFPSDYGRDGGIIGERARDSEAYSVQRRVGGLREKMRRLRLQPAHTDGELAERAAEEGTDGEE